MLRYVDFEDSYECPDDPWMFTAEDQCWDQETLDQLRDEYGIVFMTNGDAVTPVMASRKWGIVLGTEDDGTIQFQRKYGQPVMHFNPVWVEDLIADLREAHRLFEIGADK